MANSDVSLYAYTPSHAAPAVFSAIVGVSLLIHIYQCFHYRYWKVVWFLIWGGLVFTSGWVMRTLSSYHTTDTELGKNLYIAQYCLILAGPPIYAAAEYNILGRLMYYLPAHAPLHPGRLVYFFIYLGAGVEGLTAGGASLMATSRGTDPAAVRTGGTLVSVALVLQAVVECVFIGMVALMHSRAKRARMFTPNVRTLCIMLYGTSTLVLFRCIFRAIEAFGTEGVTKASQCTSLCQFVERNEWYLFVFEGLPMALYTIWLNLNHPGRSLPRDHRQYLDIDGRTERIGPGWIDNRTQWETFADPFDMTNSFKGQARREKFWLQPQQWPIAENRRAEAGISKSSRTIFGKTYRKVDLKAEEYDRA